jgi:hypothetical protein
MELINKMIAYGKEKGANEASVIVAYNNVAPQSLLLGTLTFLTEQTFYARSCSYTIL